MLKKLLFIAFAAFVLSACSQDKGDDFVTVHEAYSGLVEAEMFPKEVNDDIYALLKSTDSFGMSEYMDVETILDKYCKAEEYSWVRNMVTQLPIRAFNLIVPNSFTALANPEIVIVRQVEIANKCSDEASN